MLFTSTSYYFEMDIYRVVFTLLILAYACYSDIRKRKVFNILWLAIAGVSIAFAGYYTMEQDVAKGMSLSLYHSMVAGQTESI